MEKKSKNPKVVRTKNRRIMLSLKYAVCDSKKSKIIKEHESSRYLSSLGIKTPLINSFSRFSFVLEPLKS